MAINTSQNYTLANHTHTSTSANGGALSDNTQVGTRTLNEKIMIMGLIFG